MKQHAAIVIATLMIASMAFALSVPIISAAHEPTVSIDQSRVKFETSTILTITVQNAGPGLIDNVTIIVPSELTEFYPLVKIFKDNLVQLGGGNDNVVTLPAGTLITLTGTLTDAIVPENTIVIRTSGENVYSSTTGKWYILSENASLKLVGSTTTDNLAAGTDNATLPAALSVTLDNGHVRLVSDTQVISLGGGVVKLPANTLVYLTTASTENIPENTVTLVATKTVTLDNVDNACTTTTASVSAKRENVEAVTISAGVVLTLSAPNENVVVLPAGTRVRLPSAAAGIVRENTQVIRGVYENMLTVSGAENTSTENKPTKWAQTQVGATTVQWTGTADNIASGESLDFPFAIKTPTAAGTYTIYVRTKEIGGSTYVQKSVTLTVDNAGPTVTIAASPSTAKDNTVVTVTVTANEPLAKLDNVLVRENNAPENTKLTMTPNVDNTVWTGAYTTGDNKSRDGAATIYVKNFEDLVGNAGAETTKTFTVDRMAPPKPNIGLNITGFPDTPTNTSKWLIGGTAYDNYLGSAVVLTGGTVKIRVGTTVYENTIDGTGHWSQAIALAEGVQEVGIRYVDVAGNVGAENVENIILDSTKPSVTITAPENGGYINTKTPTIGVTLSDATLGIENAAFNAGNKSGYIVQLTYDNGDLIGNLVPKTPPTAAPFKSFAFENTISLQENVWYRVYAVAGDNRQIENVYHRFYIDVTKPIVPGPTANVNPLQDYQSITSPLVQTMTSLTIRGTGLTAESGATINIYIKDAATGATAGTETTTVGSDGSWSKTITLPQGGTEYQIEVTCTDIARNESSSVLYGFVLADAVAPTVTISAPVTGGQTDQATVVVSGTITKDSWETYNSGAMAVTATIQVGSATPGALTIGSNGSFSISAALGMGTNTITVMATDSVGHSDSKTVTIVRVAPTTTPPPVDTSAPTVTLGTLPASTTDASITVSGTVTKDAAETYSDITLTVQVGLTSVAVPISADGSYSYTVPLSMGPNTIAVRAVDRSGNASTPRTAAIERVAPTADTSAPTVTLGTLPTSTDAASVTITGTVTKDAAETYSDITVKVQSSLTSVEVQAGTDGSFSATVGLVEGSNTIGVQAVDKVGNASISATATVTRTVTPWATYAIIVIVIALILAAIAIFRKR